MTEEELTSHIAQRLGFSAEAASGAAHVVVEQLKTLGSFTLKGVGTITRRADGYHTDDQGPSIARTDDPGDMAEPPTDDPGPSEE